MQCFPFGTCKRGRSPLSFMDFDTFNLALGLHASMYVVLAVFRVIRHALTLAASPGAGEGY